MALEFVVDIVVAVLEGVGWVFSPQGKEDWKERLAIVAAMVLVFAGICGGLYLVFPLLPNWLFGIVALFVVGIGFVVLLFVLDWLLKLRFGDERKRTAARK